MFKETQAQEGGADTPRRSPAGQLRLQLPQQSAPVERGRHPESGDASGGAAASGFLGSLLGDILPF
ncbi:MULTISPECIES: hypothetical protein [unclassified Streptomyces]|uniref:hypothetical protein n=1 Tax=unclassified Streptomyces TaxID=2593676 RepID=UPI0006F30D1E|nr:MULTISPECIES: hypothetical protein [unclassified Streptomyces]KQX59452.1 hypothetical protein ASD33_04030 [Streptomyces sp. Root1304]KRB00711.1 hypothetical protein ASE09_04035 [Streptomyces sp. Root66D1]